MILILMSLLNFVLTVTERCCMIFFIVMMTIIHHTTLDVVWMCSSLSPLYLLKTDKKSESSRVSLLLSFLPRIKLSEKRKVLRKKEIFSEKKNG